MNRRWIGILIWTTICVSGGSLLFGLATRNETYAGSDLTFTADDTRTINVSAPMMRMEAADDGFFAIRNGTTTLVGKPMAKPLGWGQDAYFTAELAEAPKGEWWIEKGTGVTIHLVSETTMTVVVALKKDDTGTVLFLTLLAGFAVWFLGMIATA